ncbi:MAG: hypothetical protein ACFFCO_03185 [Promethearchaeota archaeon]
MTKTLAILCLLNAIYDLILGIVFLVIPNLAANLFGLTLDLLATMIAQIVGACLIAFAVGLFAAYRNIEGLQIIPLIKIIAHLLTVVIAVYYWYIGVVPLPFLALVGVDGFFGVVYLLFFLVSKDISFGKAFASS